VLPRCDRGHLAAKKADYDFVKQLQQVLESIKVNKIELLGKTPRSRSAMVDVILRWYPDGYFIELIGPKIA
jgi:hypothetical protein